MRRILVSITIISALAAVSYYGFDYLQSLRKDPPRSEKLTPRTTVSVIVARLQDYREFLSGYGRARALRQVAISAEIPGVIRWVSPALEAGNSVAEGEILVELDKKDFSEALQVSRSALDQALLAIDELKTDLRNLQSDRKLVHQDLAIAERKLRRLRNLKTSISSSAIDQQYLQVSRYKRELLQLKWRKDLKQKALIRADAEISLRRAQWNKAKNDLARTTIRAPYHGRIQKRHAQTDSYVTPGIPLFSIIDTTRVEVEITLPALHYGEVISGHQVILRMYKEGDPIWHGKIKRISSTIEADRTFSLYCEIPEKNPIDFLWQYLMPKNPIIYRLFSDRLSKTSPVAHGSFTLARVEGKFYRRVFVLPRIAFLGKTIFIARSNEKKKLIIKKIEPEIVRALNDIVIVKGGLEPGDMIAVTNLEEIADGSKVNVVVKQYSASE